MKDPRKIIMASDELFIGPFSAMMIFAGHRGKLG
jgi:hypothetical protein